MVETTRVGAGHDGDEPTETAVAGLERLVFFSDAVVAIAITLLALDLHVPEHVGNAEFWRDLVRNRDDYLGFLISFAVIGNHWLNHHRMWGQVTRITGRLLLCNLLWLLMIVLTPFATRVIVADGAFAGRFTLYASVQALASIFFVLAVREMDVHGLVGRATPRDVFARSYFRASVAAAAFVVSIPVAYATHWAYACWIALPVAFQAQSQLRRRRGRVR